MTSANLSNLSGMTQGNFGDKEIASDILTSQKYLSNYYYAPAILESADAVLRSSFQDVQGEIHGNVKKLFDYMKAKGWYKVSQLDSQSMNELRNAANEARQEVGQATNPGSKGIAGQQSGVMRQNWGAWQGPQGQPWSGQQNLGGQWNASPQQGWTGTQLGEGQPSMGQSSLSQGAAWYGQSSLQSGVSGQQFGQQGGQQRWGSQQGFGGQHLQGQQWGQTNQGTYGWTGTQTGEGASGMGQSSLAQGARWIGQSQLGGAGSQQRVSQGIGQETSTIGGSLGQQGVGINQQPWSLQGAGGQGQLSSQWGGAQNQFSQYGWTGTQAGEGQPGMGQSSLAQYARWGGQPSQLSSQQGQGWQGNYGWQQGFSGQQPSGMSSSTFGAGARNLAFQGGNQTGQWTGTQSGEGQPGGPSSLYQGAYWPSRSGESNSV